MLSFVKRRAQAAAEAAGRGETVASGGPAGSSLDVKFSKAVKTIGEQATRMGREAAEVRGVIEDSSKASAHQASLVADLGRQVGEVLKAQTGIGETTQRSAQAMSRARAAVDNVATEVGGIVATLREVSQAAGQITKIAMQTRLVAFNASVEAKRAGEAGRGFGVVADAVKDLAGKVEASSKEIMGTVAALDARVEALSREIRTRDDGVGQGEFHRALADVRAGVDGIEAAARNSRSICDGLATQMQSIQSEMQGTQRALDHALKRSEAFLTISENLIEVVADCGLETEDGPYIRAVQEAATKLGLLLDEAVADGRTDLQTLFDENYRPIPGTNPPQYVTRFVDLTDAIMPLVQEDLLKLSDKVVFCMSADRNGYVPTHNRKHNVPQRGDLAWDSANSRYRRIFNDRTGLASARNRRPFLLQIYRRDMGCGNFVVMKEASAPIMVQGRHWGGLRLAFHF